MTSRFVPYPSTYDVPTTLEPSHADGAKRGTLFAHYFGDHRMTSAHMTEQVANPAAQNRIAIPARRRIATLVGAGAHCCRVEQCDNFAVFIAALYLGAVSDGEPDRWNKILPRLYQPREMLATIGMAATSA